jgi:hypothetical protein
MIAIMLRHNILVGIWCWIACCGGVASSIEPVQVQEKAIRRHACQGHSEDDKGNICGDVRLGVPKGDM